MIKALALLSLTLITIFPSLGQGLESVPPVLPDSNYHFADTVTSFLLNAIDFHTYAKQGDRVYSSAVEIVDADQPWPPRWFTSANNHIKEGMINFKDVYIDARYQDDKLTFYTEESFDYPTHKQTDVAGYIVCNNKLEPIDTFSLTDPPINYHEFRINDKGEKLVMVKLDTVLDMRSVSGRKEDSMVNAYVDLVEIFDAQNKLIFVWNPVKVLGVEASYFLYRGDVSYSARPDYYDWSDGNAADFDFDGNILYSFRHIGVGKISRNDGHVIWSLDRNGMPYVFGSDTIAFYKQHGFDKVSDDSLYTTYEVYSNLHKDHLGAYGVLFRVNKLNASMQLVKIQTPANPVLSVSAGNYEVEKNGDYIMNYGVLVFRDRVVDEQSTGYKDFMEYGDRRDHIYALYRVPVLINSFKVHLLREWRPQRPEIRRSGNILVAKGETQEGWTWYSLTGPDHTIVQKEGEGLVFQPATPGVYCVAGKYGLGWSVSPSFIYEPEQKGKRK